MSKSIKIFMAIALALFMTLGSLPVNTVYANEGDQTAETTEQPSEQTPAPDQTDNKQEGETPAENGDPAPSAETAPAAEEVNKEEEPAASASEGTPAEQEENASSEKTPAPAEEGNKEAEPVKEEETPAAEEETEAEETSVYIIEPEPVTYNGVTVTVSYPSDTFEKEVRLVVGEPGDADKAALEEAFGKDYKAVDISFVDGEGNECKPLKGKSVNVTLAAEGMENADKYEVIHVKESGEFESMGAEVLAEESETVEHKTRVVLVDNYVEETVVITPERTETRKEERTRTIEVPAEISYQYVKKSRQVEKTRQVSVKSSWYNIRSWFSAPKYKTETYYVTEYYYELEPVTKKEAYTKTETYYEDVVYTIPAVTETRTVNRPEEVVENYDEYKTDVKASFTATGFSTYSLVWKVEDVEQTATIVWGYYDGDTFKELEERSTVTLDTTASTVSLENTYSGYYMIGASYTAPESSESVEISPARLTKTDNGWQITTVTKDDEGAVISTETVTIADGSEIQVIYGPKSGTTPSGSDDEDVPSPTTEKTVTDNGDGTYTITLDITGNQISETTQTGANVLLILDRTYSMAGSMGNNKNRWQVAQEASELLIDTLDCETNDIDLALITFGNVREEANSMTWTKNYQSVTDKINGMDHKAILEPHGTNWESALWYAMSDNYLPARDSDETYVIFLTDGEPNNHGTTSGSSYRPNNVPRCIADAQVYANQIGALNKVHLYGVFCGNDAGYDNLNGLITGANGVQTINGTDETTIRNAFESIAQTIVNNLGASDVAVDDGVPSLSGISANVVGEAGGYEYYIKGKDDTDFSVWENAPGAIYSNDNGVTWDLSTAGTLPAGTTYRIKFTVWPSQAAYDLIADLNNGLKDYDSLPADQKAAVTGSKETGYTLVTNTHLNTTYTFKNQDYSDAPEDLQYASMPLPTKTVSVVKEWPANMIDSYGAAVYRDPVTGETKTATEIELTLQRDKTNYLKITVKGSEGWRKDDIYVSSGNMTIKDGVVTIHETGHDYQIVEPPEFMYYWDLISDVYHPMVINGVNTLLVLDVDATSEDVDNVNYFAIGKNADGTDKIYKKRSDSDNTLKASNYRRSDLNLTKQIFDYDGETAITDENAEFTYKTKVNDSYSTDGYVWFSAWDPAAGGLVKETWVTGTGVTAELGEDGQPNGYFYAPNGTELTMTIKAGWNVRFLNLYHGSTFELEETDMPANYEFGNVAAATQYNFVHSSNADWYTATAGSTTGKITGSITEPNNNYTITYSNKVRPEFYIYHSGVAGDGNLETVPMTAVNADGTYNLYAKTTTGTLYGGYYLDYAGKGDYKDDGVKGTTGVIYTGMNYEWTDPQTVNGTEMKPAAGETYYIKEVPAYYLRNYHQINYVKSSGKLTALYLISAVDDLNYGETGVILATDDDQVSKVATKMTYKNTATGKSVTLKANTVFKSLGITAEGEYLTYFDATGSGYFAPGTFTVLPYWITPDGITVTGISTRTITIADSMTKAGISKVDN